MGLVSMATAAFFMINQRDLKRMLAYSSIEHMGILTIGLGIGTPALWNPVACHCQWIDKRSSFPVGWKYSPRFRE